MKYAILINLLILSVVITGSVFLIRTLFLPPVPTKDTTTPAEARVEKYVHETETVSVNMEYPLIPGNSEGVRQANEFLKREIVRQGEEFRNAEESEPVAERAEGDYMSSYFSGSYEVPERNSRYVVIAYNMEGYSRGAAHPFHFSDSYIFDYKNDKLVGIADMFKPGSKYLELLSTLSKEELIRSSRSEESGFELNQEILKEGTKPEEKNFKTILPLKEGLGIYFMEYQVAPYAVGPQIVVIPYEKLSNIVDPNGILGMHIK